MTMKHVDDLFSPALDGELSSAQERDFRGHLGDCERCAAAFARLEKSVAAMRGAKVSALSDREVEATVAAAFPEIAPAAPGPARGPVHQITSGRGAPWPLVLSHAAAVLLGCTLMFGGRAALFGSGTGPKPLPPERIEVPVEVIREVEVPVEVLVEVVVEVPREVIREIRVEVPVQVEVERVVVKRVPHPLQMRLDAGYRIAANVTEVAALSARGLSGALEAAAASEAMHLADAGDIATERPDTGALPATIRAQSRGAVRAPGRVRSGGALVVQRDGDRLSLRTRGPREVVVPALIDALDSSDETLAAAALGQLMSLRDRMVEAGLEDDSFPTGSTRGVAALEQPIDRAGGLRGLLRQSRDRDLEFGDASLESTSADAWRAWWQTASAFK